MNQLRTLRRLFRTQLRTRGFIAATVTVSLIFGFALITADFHAWWFSTFPWLKSASGWVKAQDSWDLFVYVFLGVTLVGYLQQIQSVLLDRHNGRVLVKLGEDEIAAETFGPESVGKPTALLGSRRRALESLFRADPGVYSLLTLVIALVALGHPFSGAVLIVFAGFLIWYFRRMVKSFTALHDAGENDGEEQNENLLSDEEDRDDVGQLPATAEPTSGNKPRGRALTKEERRARREAMLTARRLQNSEEEGARAVERARERAGQRLSQSAERMFTIINRPMVRLRIGWPILVAGAVAVAGVATITIQDMASAGDLPERGTLLVLLLVLTARSCMTLAQYWEDLAFFTASLALIDESATGQEAL